MLVLRRRHDQATRPSVAIAHGCHLLSAAARLPAPFGSGADEVELVCPSGHRTTHSLARAERLNNGWCGKCGAGISYTHRANRARSRTAR